MKKVNYNIYSPIFSGQMGDLQNELADIYITAMWENLQEPTDFERQVLNFAGEVGVVKQRILLNKYYREIYKARSV